MAVVLDTQKNDPRPVRLRHPEKAHRPDQPVQAKKPDWIRVKAPGSRAWSETQKIVREHGLISPDYFGLPAVHGQSTGTGLLKFGSKTVRFAIQQSLASFTLQGVHDGIGSGSATQLPQGMLRLTMTTCGTTLAG